MVLEVWNGFHVTMRGNAVTMTLPPMFKTKVSGICGNYNCDHSDDWTLSDGTVCAKSINNMMGGDGFSQNSYIRLG